MKIAHISDLHICNDHKKNNIRFTDIILNYIAKANYDHLVITGDLSDNSKPEDFKTIRSMLNNYGLLDSQKLSIIIGNHDIYGTVQKIEEILTFPKKCKQIKYSKKINEFCDYFTEAFEDTFRPSLYEFFPFVKKLNGLALIGINSIQKYSKIRNPFASNGKVYKKEYKELEKLLDLKMIKNRTKIVLIHHHFYNGTIITRSQDKSLFRKIENYTMKLKGKKKLIKLFKKHDINLVLHGHLHENKEYWLDGVRFLNAGETCDNRDKIKINQININRTINDVKVLILSIPSFGDDFIQPKRLPVSVPAEENYNTLEIPENVS